jgi:hypothetical protein
MVISPGSPLQRLAVLAARESNENALSSSEQAIGCHPAVGDQQSLKCSSSRKVGKYPMVMFDIRNDLNARFQTEEHPVILVCFDHKSPPPGTGSHEVVDTRRL